MLCALIKRKRKQTIAIMRVLAFKPFMVALAATVRGGGAVAAAVEVRDGTEVSVQ